MERFDSAISAVRIFSNHFASIGRNGERAFADLYPHGSRWLVKKLTNKYNQHPYYCIRENKQVYTTNEKNCPGIISAQIKLVSGFSQYFAFSYWLELLG